MFKTTVINVEEFNSKKGNPCKLVWFNNELGLPCKAFVRPQLDIKKGDNITISIMPDFNCNASVYVQK